MPVPETDYLFQKAVLWPANGFDAYGRPAVGDPEELEVRWEDGASEAVDPQGNTVALEAMVVVNQRVPVGSVMWRGELGDLPAGTSWQGEADSLMMVRTYSEIPDVKGRAVRRVAGLAKFKDTLPALTG